MRCWLRCVSGVASVVGSVLSVRHGGEVKSTSEKFQTAVVVGYISTCIMYLVHPYHGRPGYKKYARKYLSTLKYQVSSVLGTAYAGGTTARSVAKHRGLGICGVAGREMGIGGATERLSEQVRCCGCTWNENDASVSSQYCSRYLRNTWIGKPSGAWHYSVPLHCRSTAAKITLSISVVLKCTVHFHLQ